MKKERWFIEPSLFKIRFKLLSGDSACWASFLASTTIDAGTSVYNILAVASRNSLNRAGRCTSTAANALIRNNMCHDKIPPRIKI